MRRAEGIGRKANFAAQTVRNWEFLPNVPEVQNGAITEAESAMGLLRLAGRKGSLVIADRPVVVSVVPEKDGQYRKDDETSVAAKDAKAPTVFQEPDANSLLDSFGF